MKFENHGFSVNMFLKRMRKWWVSIDARLLLVMKWNDNKNGMFGVETNHMCK